MLPAQLLSLSGRPASRDPFPSPSALGIGIYGHLRSFPRRIVSRLLWVTRQRTSWRAHIARVCAISYDDTGSNWQLFDPPWKGIVWRIVGKWRGPLSIVLRARRLSLCHKERAVGWKSFFSFVGRSLWARWSGLFDVVIVNVNSPLLCICGSIWIWLNLALVPDFEDMCTDLLVPWAASLVLRRMGRTGSPEIRCTPQPSHASRR